MDGIVDVTIEEFQKLASKNSDTRSEEFTKTVYGITGIPRAINIIQPMFTSEDPDISFYLHDKSQLLRVQINDYLTGEDDFAQHLRAANQSDIAIYVIGKPNQEHNYYEALRVDITNQSYPSTDPAALNKAIGQAKSL